MNSALTIGIRTAKEIARHCLHKARADATLDALRNRRGIQTGFVSSANGQTFEAIYARGVWASSKDRAPKSGAGSALSATESIRCELPVVLDGLHCDTLLDVGCGDFTWLSSIDLPIPHYVGVDIVRAVIDANRERYVKPGKQFVCLDAASDELPDADVVLCREILFHLSFRDIRKLLRNIFKKERRFFIATTDRVTLFNADIRSGDFRALNLAARPFRFPLPVATIADSAVMPLRTLSVWDARPLAQLYGPVTPQC